MPQPSFFNTYREIFEQQLPRFLPAADASSGKLHAAMNYAVTNGGKRLRPILVYATGTTLGTELELLHAPACAIELVHCYSLVHDDLPAIDNDDLRRGKPACHRQFDEATAILAGDALMTLAVQVLADNCYMQQYPERRAKVLQTLANASADMVRGQALDISMTGQHPNLPELKIMHQLKTGALIRAAVEMGAIVATGAITDNLRGYADNIGLAFQVHDDILDTTNDSEVLGKPGGSDKRQQKTTTVDVLGLEQARDLCQELAAGAIATLDGMGDSAAMLRSIAEFSIARDH